MTCDTCKGEGSIIEHFSETSGAHSMTLCPMCTPVVKQRRSMTFQRFSALNAARCRDGFKHNIGDWSVSDWMVATVGELVEAANVLKKLNRERDGIKGNTASATVLREQLARELADTFIYLDLLSQALGIDLESAVRRTFDAKSREIGYPHLIDPDAAETTTAS